MSGHDAPVTVAVANDYELVVQGVGALLADDDRLRVVELDAGEPVTAPVDVVLYDTFGAGQGLKEAIDTIRGDVNVAAVVVYTDIADQDAIGQALDAGAAGVVSKRISGPELADAVLRVHAGEQVVLHDLVTDDEYHDVGGPERLWPGKDDGLTERESEVLSLVAQGLSNLEIGELLFLNVNTVKARLKTLYPKIGVDNRVQAAIWGVQHGFEPMEPVHYQR
jgi:DNA-binding NarL/FixJ family response regulator